MPRNFQSPIQTENAESQYARFGNMKPELSWPIQLKSTLHQTHLRGCKPTSNLEQTTRLMSRNRVYNGDIFQCQAGRPLFLVFLYQTLLKWGIIAVLKSSNPAHPPLLYYLPSLGRLRSARSRPISL